MVVLLFKKGGIIVTFGQVLLPGASAGAWALKVAVSTHRRGDDGLLQGLGIPGGR